MGPTWVLSAPDGPHVGPMNLAIGKLSEIRCFGQGLIFIAAFAKHYDDVIMTTMASQITSLTIVYSTVYSGADQRKHQTSASLAFGRGIHREPVNSPHKWPLTRKMFPFDDVIMILSGKTVTICSTKRTLCSPAGQIWHYIYLQRFQNNRQKSLVI